MVKSKQIGAWCRSGAMLLAGMGLAVAPCLAQTDAAPPSPGQGQMETGPGHRGGPEHRAEMLQHELNLTPDQFTQVKALLASERSQMEALHSNTALSHDEMRSQMTSIHQGTDTKLRALLTADQVTKYDAMEARMRARMQERQNGDAPPPPPPGGPQQ